MRLSVFAAGWGRTSLIRARGLPAFLSELQQRKFAGLEATAGELGASFEDKVTTCQLLSECGLRLIYSAYTTWDGYEGVHPGYTSPSEHLKALESELACARALESAVPGTLAHVNVHAGCDSFCEADADEYYKTALDMIDGFLTDVPCLTDGARRGVSHETHRGRPLHHPTPTRRLLAAHGADRLKLTMDISHWHVASERVIGYASTTNRPDPETLGPGNVAWGAEAAAGVAAADPLSATALSSLPAGLAAERKLLHEQVRNFHRPPPPSLASSRLPRLLMPSVAFSRLLTPSVAVSREGLPVHRAHPRAHRHQSDAADAAWGGCRPECASRARRDVAGGVVAHAGLGRV